MKNLTLWIVLLLVAVLLSACGTSEVRGEAAQTVSGQVADYEGPAGTLEAKDTINNANLGAGSLDVDGRFTLELTEPSPNLLDEPIIYTEGCPDLRVSPSDAKGLLVTEINVVANGNPVGNIAQGDIDADAESFSSTSVTRIYADRDVSVKGRCVAPGADSENVITYDLNYRRGWNIALAEIKSRPDGGIVIESSTVFAADARDIGWLYIPNPNNPN